MQPPATKAEASIHKHRQKCSSRMRVLPRAEVAGWRIGNQKARWAAHSCRTRPWVELPSLLQTFVSLSALRGLWFFSERAFSGQNEIRLHGDMFAETNPPNAPAPRDSRRPASR